MRGAIAIAVAAIGLSGCVTNIDPTRASDICMRAGFDPEDPDYPDCVQFTREYAAQVRRDRLRKELDIADHPAQHAGVKFFFNGPTLGRMP